MVFLRFLVLIILFHFYQSSHSRVILTAKDIEKFDEFLKSVVSVKYQVSLLMLKFKMIIKISQYLHSTDKTDEIPENSSENYRNEAPENFRDSVKVDSDDSGGSTNQKLDGAFKKQESKRARERLKRNKQFTSPIRNDARSDYPQRSWFPIEQMRVEKKNNANNMMCNLNIYKIYEHSHSHTSRY